MRPVTTCHLLNLMSHADGDSHRILDDRDTEKHSAFAICSAMLAAESTGHCPWMAEASVRFRQEPRAMAGGFSVPPYCGPCLFSESGFLLLIL